MNPQAKPRPRRLVAAACGAALAATVRNSMRSLAQPVQKRITVVLRTHQVAQHEQVGHPPLAPPVGRSSADQGPAFHQRCTRVDVACFAYCARADWANVDISAMSHLCEWIAMLHERPSFRTGLTIAFPRPAFFGPPDATAEEIEAEIARNAGQFAVLSKAPR